MVLWDSRGVGTAGGDAEKKNACRRCEKFKIDAAALRRFALAASQSMLSFNCD